MMVLVGNIKVKLPFKSNATRKPVIYGDMMKSGMVDDVWREKWGYNSCGLKSESEKEG